MKVSFEGYGENVGTFYNSPTEPALAGAPVAVAANGTVGACAVGARFAGFAVAAGEEFAAVQTSGYVAAEYSGATAPAVGYCGLVAGENGTVAVDSASVGGVYLVLEVDTTAKTVGFIL